MEKYIYCVFLLLEIEILMEKIPFNNFSKGAFGWRAR